MTPALIGWLEIRHNSDIDPAAAYFDTLPLARSVLRDASLLEEFRRVDPIANESQKNLRVLGSTSLLFGASALLLLSLKLFLVGIGAHLPAMLAWLAALSALVSVVLAVGPHLARSRERWLNARFLTEQMRQWHFQSWLDGEYVCLASRDPEAFERERRARWGRFQQHARGAAGTRDTFVAAESLELWHQLRPFPDLSVASEVFAAYAELRLGWQKNYFMLKRGEFALRDERTEGLSRWTIFSAVVIAAGDLVLLVCVACGRGVPESSFLALALAAVALTVTSAALRVYRSALGLSEQRERYETKWTRLVTLEQTFQAAKDPLEKQRVMREVELVEMEELREFLRVARKSSFLL